MRRLAVKLSASQEGRYYVGAILFCVFLVVYEPSVPVECVDLL